jgi:hypothetical protein
MSPVLVRSFDEWRTAARGLIVRLVPPESVQWIAEEGGGDLLSGGIETATEAPRGKPPRVPRKLMDMLESAACYRAPTAGPSCTGAVALAPWASTTFFR